MCIRDRPLTEPVAGKLLPLNVPPVSLTVTVGVAWLIVKVAGLLLAEV